jgi:biopolymer transport protein ExbD
MALKSSAHSGGHDHEMDSGAIMAEINITPLTDIFLVLLIIFMVTTSVMSQMGVDVQLPQASHSVAQAQSEGVIITLMSEGQLKVNDNDKKIKSGDFQALETALKEAFSRTSSRLVILEGDRQAFLGSAIEVIDHARSAGAAQFAIATVDTKH